MNINWIELGNTFAAANLSSPNPDTRVRAWEHMASRMMDEATASQETVGQPRELAKVALFGTMGFTANETWMGVLQTELENRGIHTYNPNAGIGGGRDFHQESFHLTHSPILAMNFDENTETGRTARAELPLAVLSAVLNGQILYVNFESDQLNRQILEADLVFYKEIFGDRLLLRVTHGPFDAQRMASDIQEVMSSPKPINARYPDQPIPPIRGIAFSGSKREDLNSQYRNDLFVALSRGLGEQYPIVDTHNDDFDSNIYVHRIMELQQLFDHSEQVAFGNSTSLSVMSNIMASLVISVANGGHTTAYMMPRLMDDPDVRTIQSHLRELFEQHPELRRRFTLTNNLREVPLIVAQSLSQT